MSTSHKRLLTSHPHVGLIQPFKRTVTCLLTHTLVLCIYDKQICHRASMRACPGFCKLSIFPQYGIKVVFCSRVCYMKVCLFCEQISGLWAKVHISSVLEEPLSFLWGVNHFNQKLCLRTGVCTALTTYSTYIKLWVKSAHIRWTLRKK